MSKGLARGAGEGFAEGSTLPQSRRAFRACIAIGLVVALVCALDVPLGAAQGLSRIEQLAEGDSPPSWFAEELFSLDGFEGVRVASDCAVVGFEMDGSAARSLEFVTGLMKEKGWKCLESGLEGSAAFVKVEGACRWAWVSCVDVAGSTSVVVQCVPVE